MPPIPPAPTKRPRGRPRKHPLPPPLPAGEQPKRRSKGGCLTCRRKRKKCGEEKPACMNCLRLGKVCGGYDFGSLSRKTDGRRYRLESIPLSSSPSEASTPGVTSSWSSFSWPSQDASAGAINDEDRTLLEEMRSADGRQFAPWTTESWSFYSTFVPLAMSDTGIMHALLSLFSSNQPESRPGLRNREAHHQDQALRYLHRHWTGDYHSCHAERQNDDTLAARAVLVCMKAAINGSRPSTHPTQTPWRLLAHMVLDCPRETADPGLRHFLHGFVTFHLLASLPPLGQPVDGGRFSLPLFMPKGAAKYFGAAEPLFIYIAQVHGLRRDIRLRREVEGLLFVTKEHAEQAASTAYDLEAWGCACADETARWLLLHAYRTATWIYLRRTVSPPRPSAALRSKVDDGLFYLETLIPDESVTELLVFPLFAFGFAAFHAYQRVKIEGMLETLRAAWPSETLSRASHVLAQVWRLMDAEDAANWDWEVIMKGLGWNAIVS